MNRDDHYYTPIHRCESGWSDTISKPGQAALWGDVDHGHDVGTLATPRTPRRGILVAALRAEIEEFAPASEHLPAIRYVSIGVSAYLKFVTTLAKPAV